MAVARNARRRDGVLRQLVPGGAILAATAISKRLKL